MNTKPTPTDLDVFPPENEAEYHRWFRAKVEKALADPRTSIPHEQVVAEMRERFKRLRKKAKSSKSA